MSLLFLLLAHHKVGEGGGVASSSVQVPFRVARSASGHISWQRGRFPLVVQQSGFERDQEEGDDTFPGCVFSGVERRRRGLFRNLVTSGGAAGHHFRQEFANLLGTKIISGKLRSVFAFFRDHDRNRKICWGEGKAGGGRFRQTVLKREASSCVGLGGCVTHIRFTEVATCPKCQSSGNAKFLKVLKMEHLFYCLPSGEIRNNGPLYRLKSPFCKTTSRNNAKFRVHCFVFGTRSLAKC